MRKLIRIGKSEETTTINGRSYSYIYMGPIQIVSRIYNLHSNNNDNNNNNINFLSPVLPQAKLSYQF